MNTQQNTQLNKLSALRSAFAFYVLPNLMKTNFIIQQQVESAIKETELIFGEEKTKELVEQFRAESYENPDVVSHKYIISKLYDARESARSGYNTKNINQ